ncbi:ABC transporter ATP-binding protein [Cytophagaceae bacterium ABcell3]|nr:ABC transporter ATP-binding protein [Cytophagaceae bacterium ABcell3]
MKTFLRLISFGRPYRRYIPKYVILAVLGVIFGVVNFTLLIPLLSVLFETYSIPDELVKPDPEVSRSYLIDLFNYYMYVIIEAQGKSAALQYVCAVLFGFVFFANFFRYTAQRVINQMRTYTMYNMKKVLFERLVDNDLSYHHNQKKGDLLSILSNDMQEVEQSIVTSMQAFKEPLLFIGYFMVLFSISAELTLFSIIILPVSGVMIGTLARNLRKQSQQSQLFLGSVLNIADETLGGIKVIKGFNASGAVKNKFDGESSYIRSLITKIMHKRELASPLSEVLGVLIAIVVILYGSSMVFNGKFSAEAFIAYIAIFSQVLSPAKAITHSIAILQRGIAAGERVLKVIDSQPEIISNPGAIVPKEFKEKIEFKNVGFSYGEDPVLENINLTLEKGRKVALVGPSGGGKSTFADLIPRFYDVKEGDILVDGTSIKNIELTALRSFLGIVTQEPVLFNDTIFNNIAFGMKGVSKEAVVNAARIANAHDFIVETDNGYETTIGDRGVKLSGGQRQRISIARAVLKNPPILILDEATSALDTESEKLVQDALNKLMKNRTSIVIAHRLSTIVDADEIIVLEKGTIRERGTHQELLAAKGVYHKLYAKSALFEE